MLYFTYCVGMEPAQSKYSCFICKFCYCCCSVLILCTSAFSSSETVISLWITFSILSFAGIHVLPVTIASLWLGYGIFSLDGNQVCLVITDIAFGYCCIIYRPETLFIFVTTQFCRQRVWPEPASPQPVSSNDIFS